MDNNSRLIKNTIIYSLGDILPKILGFFTFPILTAYLSPEEFGTINYVNSITTFLLVLGLLCINTFYLVYFYKEKSIVEQKKLLGNLTVFLVAFNLVLCSLAIIFGSYLFKKLGSNIDFYPYIFLGILIHFTNIFPILPSALFRLQERPLPLVLLSFAKGIFRLVFIYVFVKYFAAGAKGVLIIDLILSALIAIIFSVITFKNMVLIINSKQLLKALKFSLPLLPGTIAYFLISTSDRLLIDHYLTLNELGIYSTAVTLAFMLNILSNGAYKAFEPYFFKIHSKPNFLVQFIQIRNYFAYVLLLSSFFISLFSKELILTLTSSEYHRSFIFVPLLILGVFFNSYNLLYSTIVTAKEKTKVNSLITIVGGIFSILINILLIPKIGLFGAAISSFLTYAFMNVFYRHYAGLHDRQTSIMISVVIISVLVYFTVYVIEIHQILLDLFFKIGILIAGIALLTLSLKINLRQLILLVKK